MIECREEMNGTLVFLETTAQSLAVDGNGTQGIVIDFDAFQGLRPLPNRLLEFFRTVLFEQICISVRTRWFSSETEPMESARLELSNPFRDGSHFANSAKSRTDNRRQHGVKSMALSLTPARVGDLFQYSKQAPRIGGSHWSHLLRFVKQRIEFCKNVRQFRRNIPRKPTTHIQCQTLSNPARSPTPNPCGLSATDSGQRRLQCGKNATGSLAEVLAD